MNSQQAPSHSPPNGVDRQFLKWNRDVTNYQRREVSDMDAVNPSPSRRLVRALLAGGILAAGWFVTDLVTAEPAAAAAQIDLIPSAETPVSDLVDTVVSIVPVAAPLVTTLDPVVDPVSSAVDAVVAPLSPVTIPILDPVRESTQPVVDTVVTPILEGTAEVITPIVAPVVEGIVPVVDAVVVTVPVIEQLAVTTIESSGILAGGSSPAASLAILGALAAGVASFAPGGPFAPTGRGALTPSPEGAAFGGGLFVGDLVSGIPAAHGALAPASAAPAHAHASPVFESDTTPD